MAARSACGPSRPGVKTPPACVRVMRDRPARAGHPPAVLMDAAGRLKICRGTRCTGADCGCIEGFDYPRLAYGRSIAFAPFGCASLRVGVRCTVTRTRWMSAIVEPAVVSATATCQVPPL